MERDTQTISIDNKEKRDHYKTSSSHGHGTSTTLITCPFCDVKCIAYIWSLAGSGKKCPLCGALHTNYGYSIRTKEMEANDE